MRMMFKAWVKKLFGADYRRLARIIFTELVVFWGLLLGEISIRILPQALWLMSGVSAAALMWQALSAKDNAAYLQHMRMLPYDEWKIIVSYAAALGCYVFLTKTVLLLAVAAAVSDVTPFEIAVSISFAVGGLLLAVGCFLGKNRGTTGSWLCGLPSGKSPRRRNTYQRYAMRRYFFRYLTEHKNYLANTAILWGVAAVLPFLFPQMESRYVIPVGLAVLTVNTPMGTLLSADPALEQAVRLLPGGGRMFLTPYGLLLFCGNLLADSIFLGSLQLCRGGVTGFLAVAVGCLALLGAMGSVLLEWFWPVRGWRVESDLWHHPRKYVIPAAVLLLAVWVCF